METAQLSDHSIAGENLTETVRAFRHYLPKFLPMPHPSPRNRFWLTKNPWFATDLLPWLQSSVAAVLALDRRPVVLLKTPKL